MDIFSHGLWTGLIFKKDKKIWWPVFFGIAPDIFSNGIYAVISFINGIALVDVSGEHLNPVRPAYVTTLYSLTHSLIIFALIFLIVWLVLRRPWWPLAGWGIHILIDIPFHSAKFFATPFLYPVSSFKVDSVSWGSGYIVFLNYLVLAVIFLYIFVTKNKRKKLKTYLFEKRKILKR